MQIGKTAEPIPHKTGFRPRLYAITPPVTANTVGTRYNKIAGEKISTIFILLREQSAKDNKRHKD